MGAPITIDHPAVGAAHAYLPGNADSLVAAAALMRMARRDVWVTLAREHRLPVLLERPLSDVAAEVWCLGYSGTGNESLPAALEAHVTLRPVHWMTCVTGRLSMQAAEIPGVDYHNLPGGSLVPLVLGATRTHWDEQDRLYERLGFILGRYRGARPSDFELRLVNALHAASVQVRNQERFGAGLVRELAMNPIASWPGLESVRTAATAGEARIVRSRRALEDTAPSHGGRSGPAIWILPVGSIDRGTHGKALAARSYARQAPAVLLERVPRGFTKAWVVLPEHKEDLWLRVMNEVVRFSIDFSYTGLRGAGAVAAGDLDELADSLWRLFEAHA